MYVRLVEFGLVALLVFSLFNTASGDPSQSRGSLVYSRDQLFALRSSAALPKERPDVPPELRRRKRACRARVERRARRRRYRPILPSIIMGNVRSLPNKMDELAALTRHQREYRECSLLLFMETWLTALIPDTAAQLEGFTLLRADRSRESGKRKGAGLAVFVNDRWCNPGHITIKEQHCCKDIELIDVSMRPHYLPREFTHALAVVVYIPPSANADAACDVLLSAVSRLQTQHPDALLLISGDFNHASPSSSLPKFTQYVTCHTRDNKTLDLFYANTKEAYHSLPLPPLGRANHNLVHLQSVYKPLVQRQPAVTRTVKKWSEEAVEALKDCFNTTLWDVFSDVHGEDIDNLTNCITDYINFCVENTVPTSTVRSFSNSKPLITPDIKALLKEKKRAFVSGDKEELKTVQRELRRKIRQEKDNYRRKMENQLQQNNICGVWKGLKTISGFKEQKSQPVGDRAYTQIQPNSLVQQHKQQQQFVALQSQSSQKTPSQSLQTASIQPSQHPVPVLPKPAAHQPSTPSQQATIFHSTISPHALHSNLNHTKAQPVQLTAINLQIQPTASRLVQDSKDKPTSLVVRESCPPSTTDSQQQSLTSPLQTSKPVKQPKVDPVAPTIEPQGGTPTKRPNASPVTPHPAMTSGNETETPSVTGSAPQNGENKPPQAIVKPQVLTHVIEGFVIQEGAEPFPVCVEHLPILIDSAKKLDHQLSSDPDNTPVSNAANSDSETDDISQPEKEQEPKLTCEYCGWVDFAYTFKGSKRFCSVVCAKRYNVGCTKRMGLFHPEKNKQVNNWRRKSQSRASIEAKKQTVQHVKDEISRHW
ncbi:polyhomeotic-like protein 2b isoform X4 [Takifugu flavidus]|uniref:polyhomeotic-like protein 2b isoform X4 n=2 Tax=Takifugu flavidus TaxID=433684 RepID=UPI002544A9E3|nr:polyhomeotic-like protein 2b isoform X4 [Takifugu flavidus]